ncbi:hypothetical protein CLAIMM_04865 [Cladophialophora immunda]|nr:hypothetical protein CLAIMM_04865 [Cladophialophora immunda]
MSACGANESPGQEDTQSSRPRANTEPTPQPQTSVRNKPAQGNVRSPEDSFRQGSQLASPQSAVSSPTGGPGLHQRMADLLQNFPIGLTYQCKTSWKFSFPNASDFTLERGVRGKVLGRKKTPDAQNQTLPCLLQIELPTTDGMRTGNIPEDKVTVWPEGFPFVCILDHPASHPGLLALQKGDQGQVLRLHWGKGDKGNTLQGQPNHVPWFHVYCKGRQGYVNFWALEIGRVNAIGIVTIVHDPSASVTAPFFGPSDGLNRTLPMNEEFAGANESVEVMTFTKSTLPGRVSVYSRAPYKAMQSITTDKIVLYGWDAIHSSDHRHHFTIAVSHASKHKSLARIQPGTVIYPSFEISEAGPHPMQWARLPEFGPISNWQEARRLAFCVKFQRPDQEWEKVYIQASKVFEFAPGSGSTGFETTASTRAPEGVVQAPDKLTGALMNYIQAVGLIRSLEQQYVSNDYDWMIDFGMPSILEVTRSFLNQEIKIKPMTASNVPVQRATAAKYLRSETNRVGNAMLVTLAARMQALKNQSGNVQNIRTTDARIVSREESLAPGQTLRMPQTFGLYLDRSRRTQTM